MTNDEKEILTGFLIQGITSSGYKDAEDIQLKIDLLERGLEVLRFKHKCLENKIPFEDFISGTVCLKNGRLNFTAPDKKVEIKSGTSAGRLQPKLMLFLLLNHGQYYKIYDIIEKFVDKVWDELSIEDFKKTQTGVTRCFTNTRFAATTLREYGFLKYTDTEAYKTWTLSLPGLLVASKVLEEKNWKIPEYNKAQNYDLHPDISQAWLKLQTYDDFVDRLRSVCKPNVEVFGTFKGVLKKAHTILSDYWYVLEDNSLSQKDRKKESMKRLKQLDKQPNIDKFYEEFSKCMKDTFDVL